MKQTNLRAISKYPRILSLALSSYGVGFARVEGLNTLADWGVKFARGNKNAKCLSHIKRLIDLHQPEVMILEHASSSDVRRHPRVRQLTEQIIALANQRKIPILLLQRKDVFKSLLPVGRGTKHAMAEVVVETFPEELARQLPPKRKPWMKEDYRMAIFTAAALCLAFRQRAKFSEIQAEV